MSDVVFFIVLIFAAGHFGWAIICGIKDRRLHNRYGANLEVDFREEPIGFFCVTIFYIAIWLWLAYLAVNAAINAYEFAFN